MCSFRNPLTAGQFPCRIDEFAQHFGVSGRCRDVTERVRQLEAVGFVWKTAEQSRWAERFQQLAEFHRAHGHWRVPKSQFSLLNWIRSQRKAYAAGNLEAEYVKRLNEIGFAWRAMPQLLWNAKWDEHLREFIEFHRTHGHWRVPRAQRRYRHLYEWVKGQRKLHAAGHLRPDRLQRLAALNVPWVLSAVTAPGKEAQG